MCVPQIITYAAVEKGIELKGEQKKLWYHDASTGAAAVGKKARLGTKQR